MSWSTSVFAFFGAVFPKDAPPMTATGPLDFEVFEAEDYVALATRVVGNLMGCNEIQEAIYIPGSCHGADPNKNPPAQPLIEDPAWRGLFRQECEKLGILNPPEPHWVLAWDIG